MRIKWTGSGPIKRLVGRYEWSQETGYVQDVVEPDLAAELLTEPSGLFVAESPAEEETLFAALFADKGEKQKPRKSARRTSETATPEEEKTAQQGESEESYV